MGCPRAGVLGARSVAFRRGRDAADPAHPGAVRCRPGMRRVFAELGTPADTLDCAFVNGFMYTRLAPADRPPIVRPRTCRRDSCCSAVGRFHPEFRRRTKAAERARTERPWRKVVADWENGGRALIESRNLAHSEGRSRRARRSNPDRARPGSASSTAGQLGAPLLAARLRPRSDRVRTSPAAASGASNRADAIPLLEGASPSTVGPDAHRWPGCAPRSRSPVTRPPDLDEVERSVPTAGRRSRPLPRVPRSHDDQPIRHRRSDARRRCPTSCCRRSCNGVERAVGDGLQHRIEVVRARVPIATPGGLRRSARGSSGGDEPPRRQRADHGGVATGSAAVGVCWRSAAAWWPMAPPPNRLMRSSCIRTEITIDTLVGDGPIARPSSNVAARIDTSWPMLDRADVASANESRRLRSSCCPSRSPSWCAWCRSSSSNSAWAATARPAA